MREKRGIGELKLDSSNSKPTYSSVRSEEKDLLEEDQDEICGLDDDDNDECEQSYETTGTGTIRLDKITVHTTGMNKSNAIQKSLQFIAKLGKGAGGVVYKGIHLQTLRLMAVKSIKVNEKEKRHQMARELVVLNSNLLRGTTFCIYYYYYYIIYII